MKSEYVVDDKFTVPCGRTNTAIVTWSIEYKEYEVGW